MKKSVLLFTLAAFIASCGDDDEKPSYNFKNQNVAGKIGNVTWQFGDGYAERIGIGDDTELHINLFTAVEGRGCDLSPSGDEVLFAVPHTVGVHRLHFDVNDWENSIAVTLFEEATFKNNTATEGAIEILSITDTEVVGRIDAFKDDKNAINGNFTVTICQ